MVGFKTVWTLLILLVFAACVPQTKSTSCKSSEAFSSVLRKCIPLTQGPNAFIRIKDYLPTAPLVKYKNDLIPVTLQINFDKLGESAGTTVYVEWIRVYNGMSTTVIATTNTQNASSGSSSYVFLPTYLGNVLNEVGVHSFQARLKLGDGTVLDSQNFQVTINQLPKPIIQTASVNPAQYYVETIPSPTDMTFRFDTNNNSAIMLNAGYETVWTLSKAGVLIHTTSNLHPNEGATDTNVHTYLFNPLARGLGNFILRARVTNFAAEIVAEQQWSITVAHPPLQKVTSRNIYAGLSNPTFTTVTDAFNGVPYTTAPTLNFIPQGQTTQGQYCVTVADGEGSYVGDSQFVKVNFYLDGASSFIYSGTTTAMNPTVCLSTSPSLSALVFNNSSPTATQSHTIVARVVDERTNTEYSASDMQPSLGTYPITWDVSVKPQNKAPVVSFGASALTCVSTIGDSKNDCTVASDTNFTVKVNLASDDFYTLPTNEANFNYSIRLYENSVLIHTCSKASPGASGVTDTDGSDGYDCTFRINSFNGSGPLNTMARTYQIQAEIMDTGSPLSPTPMTSNTLVWNFPLNKVTETETAPSIANWSVAGAVNEGSNITFSADITDSERDNHTYTIEYCLNVGCTSFQTLTSGSISRTTNANPYAFSVNYPLNEYFLHNLTAMGCHQLLRNATCNVQFRLIVADVVYTNPIPLSTTSGFETSTITNINPAPVLSPAFSNPAPASFIGAIGFVGFPISISNNPASILVDNSQAGVEATFRYQWYARNSSSVTTWQPINGAESHNLVWTPSLIKASNLGLDNPVSFMLCVDDQPAAAVVTPNVTDSVCSHATPWNVTVRNNVAVAQDLSTAPSSTELATLVTDRGTETAIWYETPSTFNTVTSSAAYMAMIGNDQRIHIKKVLVRDNGQIDTINATNIISFNAVNSGVLEAVKDLSITGTANELYVAYLASRTGSPGSFYPQVRRIDFASGSSPGKSAPNNHANKFGFDYDGLGFTNACVPAIECSPTAASGVTTVTFSPTAAITGTVTLATPNGNFVVNFGTYNSVDTICTNCTGTQMATELRNIINASTNPLLAGYSATSAAGVVTIYGARANDYFDAFVHANARIADQMSDIYVSSGNWYVTFINNSLGGGFNDKLSFYAGATAAPISSAAVTLGEPNTLPGLANMDAAIKFDSYFDGTSLWIAMVSKIGSAGKLYKVTPGSYSYTVGTDEENIMPMDVVLDVQVSASATRTFVGAKLSSGGVFKIGVYDNAVTTISEFVMDDAAHVDASSVTEDIFNPSDIASYKIIPYGAEARIIASSKGTGSVYHIYMARLRTVGPTWMISCGDCEPVSEFGESVSPYTQVSAASIRVKSLVPALSAYRLSTDGSVSGQGIKDVAFINYGRIDSAVAGSCDPAIGILNVEGEQIGSSSSFRGTAPNVDAGLFRSPLVKN